MYSGQILMQEHFTGVEIENIVLSRLIEEP